MYVELLNPEEVKATLESVGKFASICKTGEEISTEKAIKIGKHCLSSGHFSPCRGIMWKFKVTGISRVCSHQLVRHHVGVAINQSSGVFQEVDLDAEEIIPGSVAAVLAEYPELGKMYQEYLQASKEVYAELKRRGVSNSDARYHMPQSTPTSVNIAVTPEALIHIANERLCNRAQWEIRLLVRKMCDLVGSIEPFFIDYLQPKCVPLHGCPEQFGCGYYNALKIAKMSPKSGVEQRPIEKQLSIYTCKNCGYVIHVKDDDENWKNVISKSDGVYCRKCLRKLNEVQNGETDKTSV